MNTTATKPEPDRQCRCSSINLDPESNEGPNPDCPIHGDAVATSWERLATGYDH